MDVFRLLLHTRKSSYINNIATFIAKLIVTTFYKWAFVRFAIANGYYYEWFNSLKSPKNTLKDTHRYSCRIGILNRFKGKKYKIVDKAVTSRYICIIEEIGTSSTKY